MGAPADSREFILALGFLCEVNNLALIEIGWTLDLFTLNLLTAEALETAMYLNL